MVKNPELVPRLQELVASQVEWPMFLVVCMFIVLIVPLVVFLWYEQQCEKKPPTVMHMMPQGCTHWRHSERKTVVQLLAQSLPPKIPKQDRASRASALLRAAGLDIEGSCLFGGLSESQKQVVYILRLGFQIASDSQVSHITAFPYDLSEEAFEKHTEERMYRCAFGVNNFSASKTAR